MNSALSNEEAKAYAMFSEGDVKLAVRKAVFDSRKRVVARARIAGVPVFGFYYNVGHLWTMQEEGTATPLVQLLLSSDQHMVTKTRTHEKKEVEDKTTSKGGTTSSVSKSGTSWVDNDVLVLGSSAANDLEEAHSFGEDGSLKRFLVEHGPGGDSGGDGGRSTKSWQGCSTVSMHSFVRHIEQNNYELVPWNELAKQTKWETKPGWRADPRQTFSKWEELARKRIAVFGNPVGDELPDRWDLEEKDEKEREMRMNAVLTNYAFILHPDNRVSPYEGILRDYFESPQQETEEGASWITEDDKKIAESGVAENEEYKKFLKEEKETEDEGKKIIVEKIREAIGRIKKCWNKHKRNIAATTENSETGAERSGAEEDNNVQDCLQWERIAKEVKEEMQKEKEAGEAEMKETTEKADVPLEAATGNDGATGNEGATGNDGTLEASFFEELASEEADFETRIERKIKKEEQELVAAGLKVLELKRITIEKYEESVAEEEWKKITSPCQRRRQILVGSKDEAAKIEQGVKQLREEDENKKKNDLVQNARLQIEVCVKHEDLEPEACIAQLREHPETATGDLKNVVEGSAPPRNPEGSSPRPAAEDAYINTVAQEPARVSGGSAASGSGSGNINPVTSAGEEPTGVPNRQPNERDATGNGADTSGGGGGGGHSPLNAPDTSGSLQEESSHDVDGKEKARAKKSRSERGTAGNPRAQTEGRKRLQRAEKLAGGVAASWSRRMVSYASEAVRKAKSV
ncbi:unnamed protein product [Amoebophrya sp. A25]|nr:unnamed protein product [Amoebophrya sp. A25]|eukprot:GSA25T00001338001.1